MIEHERLTNALRAEVDRGRSVPLLILRLPEFAEIAWREGKRVASRVERTTAQAFREAANRIVRDDDRLFHDAGSDWFAVAMLAPARERNGATRDARAALERISAAMSLRTGRRMETGWWPVATYEEIDNIEATVDLALERGARERERFEFLATVGHELRTPLTSIRGYIETLLDGDVDPETSRRFLETARREALRLGRLVDGMLEFSLLDLGMRSDETGTTNIGLQVAAAFDALEPIARERDITLRASISSDLVARIDPDACMHAMVNLIENAIKYGNRGGTVAIGGTSEPPFVEVYVDDDGPGVPQPDRDTIFALRSRGVGVDAPGAGIGLAIVRTIVERVGGNVCVEDSPIGGARFRMSLPAAHPREAESAALLS